VPEPKEGENRDTFVKRCIPALIDEGKEQDEAVAICNSMWKEAQGGKAIPVGTLQRLIDEAKAESMEDYERAVVRGQPADNAEQPDNAPTVAVKFLREQDGGAVVGGHIALWGDPEHKDLQHDYFTPDTWLGLDEYPTVPALFHHGLDPTVGASVIGKRIKAGVDGHGAWVEDWLDKSNKYWAMVKPLLDAEVLHYSPGSAPHLVKRQEDGRLDSYPIVEDTMTVIPAQHRLRPIEQIKAAYKAAGLEFTLDEGAEPSGDGEPDKKDEAGGASAGAEGQDESRSESGKAKARAIELLAEIEMITMEGT